MTADVYAGDDSLAEPSGSPEQLSTVVFRIEADAEADVTCRIANVLRIANRAPTRGTLLTEGGERTTISVEIEGVSLGKAEYLLRKLSQLTCVTASEVEVTGIEPSASTRVLRVTPEGVVTSD